MVVNRYWFPLPVSSAGPWKLRRMLSSRELGRHASASAPRSDREIRCASSGSVGYFPRNLPTSFAICSGKICSWRRSSSFTSKDYTIFTDRGLHATLLDLLRKIVSYLPSTTRVLLGEDGARLWSQWAFRIVFHSLRMGCWPNVEVPRCAPSASSVLFEFPTLILFSFPPCIIVRLRNQTASRLSVSCSGTIYFVLIFGRK